MKTNTVTARTRSALAVVLALSGAFGLMSNDAAAQCQPPPAGNPGCGPATRNPVHLATGNKFLQETDLPALPGTLGLEFVRYYNSRLSDMGSIGRGWRHSYDVNLFITGDSLQIMRADGKRIIFPRDAKTPTLCVSLDRSEGEVLIEKLANNRTQYRWRQLDGTEHVFDEKGQLSAIRAQGGEQLLIARTPQGEITNVSSQPIFK